GKDRRQRQEAGEIKIPEVFQLSADVRARAAVQVNIDRDKQRNDRGQVNDREIRDDSGNCFLHVEDFSGHAAKSKSIAIARSARSAASVASAPEKITNP